MTVTDRLRDDHVLILGLLEGALSDIEPGRPAGSAQRRPKAIDPRGPLRENTGLPGGVS